MEEKNEVFEKRSELMFQIYLKQIHQDLEMVCNDEKLAGMAAEIFPDTDPRTAQTFLVLQKALLDMMTWEGMRLEEKIG